MNPDQTLRYCRRRAGFTQRELATRVGIPQPAIARIESGKVTPRVDTLVRLLSACNFGFELRSSPGLDRSAIRELLRLTPRQRLELAAAEANNLEQLSQG
ncbi:MAG: helix-turn-helix domain-containing protein [Acidimicrobiia bacterium]